MKEFPIFYLIIMTIAISLTPSKWRKGEPSNLEKVRRKEHLLRITNKLILSPN
jgi:hypothetical protein